MPSQATRPPYILIITLCIVSFLIVLPRPRKSTLFPYTTLFRSRISGVPHMAWDNVYRLVQRIPRGKVLTYGGLARDRKSTRLNSSHGYISYAVYCAKKKSRDPALDARAARLNRAPCDRHRIRRG